MIDQKKLEQILYKGTYLAVSPSGNVAIGMPDGDIEVLTLHPAEIDHLNHVLAHKLKTPIYFEGTPEYVDIRARLVEELKAAARGKIKESDIKPVQNILRIAPFMVDPDLIINVAYSREHGVWVITD